MAWEIATIIGSLGVSFYLLYLKEELSEEHETLKLGLMLASWLSILVVLEHIRQIITESAPTATENLALSTLFYQTWIWLTIGFTAYWFIYAGGKWIKSFGGSVSDGED